MDEERGKVDGDETFVCVHRHDNTIGDQEFSVRYFVRPARHPKPQWMWERDGVDGCVLLYTGDPDTDDVIVFPAEVTDAQADAIVAVLNGGTQEPVAWLDDQGFFERPEEHAEHESDGTICRAEVAASHPCPYCVMNERDRYKALVDNQEVLAEGVCGKDGSVDFSSHAGLDRIWIGTRHAGKTVVVAVKDETP